MKKIKILFIPLFVMTAVLPLRAQQHLTLEEAIAVGMKNNTGIIIAKGNMEISGKEKGLGTAGFLPVLNLAGNYTMSRSDVSTNSPFSFGSSSTDNYGGSVNLNWRLYDGLLMFYNNRKYRDLSESGKWQLRQTSEQQVAQIISSYLNVVRLKALLNITREGAAISKLRLEKEEIRKNLGGASTTDYLSAKVAYNNDRLNILKNKNQLEIARRQLNILLGRNPETQFSTDTVITVNRWQVEPDTLWKYARLGNSSLALQKYQLSLSEVEIGARKSAFHPRLDAVGSYSYSNNELDSDTRGIISSETQNSSIGLSLSWNLFNGNRDNINIQTAKIRRRNSEYLLAETERQVMAQIKNQLETYLNSLEAYELELENRKVAKRNLALFEERFQLGSATFLEYRQAQLTYLQSRSNIVDAAYLTRVAETELKRLAGMLIVDEPQMER
jgi:outer membrane protein TolC